MKCSGQRSRSNQTQFTLSSPPLELVNPPTDGPEQGDESGVRHVIIEWPPQLQNPISYCKGAPAEPPEHPQTAFAAWDEGQTEASLCPFCKLQTAPFGLILQQFHHLPLQSFKHDWQFH